MKDVSKTLGQNIANLRKARGLTQGQLAERFNYTDKAISKWEHGDVCPDVNTLTELADFFGVTTDYMIHYHAEEAIMEDHSKDPAAIRRNRIIMTALVSVFFWTLAAVIFSGYAVTHVSVEGNKAYQLGSIAFAWAVPLTLFTIWVYNKRYGKPKVRLPLLIALSWASALAFYLTYGLAADAWELWFIWLTALPLTVAFLIVHISRYNVHSKKEKTEENEEK